jgi:hypothetical protein
MIANPLKSKILKKKKKKKPKKRKETLDQNIGT